MKKLIFVLVFMFIFILPVSASYPDEAYEVPWSESKQYFMYENANGLNVLVFNTNQQYFMIGTNLYMTPNINWGSYWQGTMYRLNGTTWQPQHYSLLPSFISNGTYRVLQIGTISAMYHNFNIYSSSSFSTILFQSTPFLLPLTPLEVMEKEKGKAIQMAVGLISQGISMILPIGLGILSTLLAIRYAPVIWNYFMGL